MSFEKISKEISQKKYDSVYFFQGEEPYFIDQLVDQIEKNVLEESEKDFNQTILYGKETSVGEILSVAKRYPMMAPYNVVIVKEAQHLFKKEAENNLMISYLEQKVPTTVLVFAHKYKKLDARKKIGKAFKKHGVFFDSKKIYENQVPGWIVDLIKQKGYTITEEAAFLMAGAIGNELSNIANEVGKLLLNIAPGTAITPELIEQNVGISRSYNAFELNKALGAKDILKSNQIVNYFALNEKQFPIVVTLGMLYTFFSKLIHYHYVKSQPQQKIAEVLGVHPFFVKEYEQAGRNYSIRQLVPIIGYLSEYDLKSKGVNNSSVSGGSLLKELAFKILHV